jgi:NADH-quinone oxidoreductase subunit M
MIFQGLSDKGFIFLGMASAFGSIGSYLYVFRPLSAVFLGQLSPRHEELKEANPLMLISMLLLTLMSLILGVLPNVVLTTIAKIQTEIGLTPIMTDGFKTMTANGSVNMLEVFVVFGYGFLLVLILFLVLPKSRRVGLMDTYTSAEFIYTPELLHYSSNFYAPFERLYQHWPSVLPWFTRVSTKLKELGEWVESFFFSKSPTRGIMWLVVIAILAMVGGTL